MIKQRRESVVQFQAAHRYELAKKESEEITVLENYLPPQMNDTEIDQAIEAAIASTNASSMKDMGKVMGILKSQIEGKADMSIVSNKVKSALSQ